MKKGLIGHNTDGTCPEKTHPRVIRAHKPTGGLTDRHICEKDKDK